MPVVTDRVIVPLRYSRAWTRTPVHNTDASKYTSSIENVAVTFNCKFLNISYMPKPVSVGPPEPESSQRNAFDVLVAGSSSKPRKLLLSVKTSKY